MNKKTAAALIVPMLFAVTLTACTNEVATSGAQQQGQEVTEQAFKQQSAAVPYPADQLKDSLERENLRRRLLITNKPDSIWYVYLLLEGVDHPIGFYTIKGKISNTDSQMTTDQLITWTCKDSHGCVPVVVNAPGDDGSYGPNEDGDFFFTTDGAYVSMNLKRIVSDQPVPVWADVPELKGAK